MRHKHNSNSFDVRFARGQNHSEPVPEQQWQPDVGDDGERDTDDGRLRDARWARERVT